MHAKKRKTSSEEVAQQDQISFVIKSTGDIYKTFRSQVNTLLGGSLLSRMIDPSNEDMVDMIDGSYCLAYPSEIYSNLFRYLTIKSSENTSELDLNKNPLLEYDWSLTVEQCDQFLKDCEYFLFPDLPSSQWKLEHSLRQLNEWPIKQHYADCARLMYDLLCDMLFECLHRFIQSRNDGEEDGSDREVDRDRAINIWEQVSFTVSVGDLCVNSSLYDDGDAEYHVNFVISLEVKDRYLNDNGQTLKTSRSADDPRLTQEEKQLMLKTLDFLVQSDTNRTLMDLVSALFERNGIGKMKVHFEEVRECDIDFRLNEKFYLAPSFVNDGK